MFLDVTEFALDPLPLLTALRHVGEVAFARGLRLVMPCAQGLKARVVVSLGLDVIDLKPRDRGASGPVWKDGCASVTISG